MEVGQSPSPTSNIEVIIEEWHEKERLLQTKVKNLEELLRLILVSDEAFDQNDVKFVTNVIEKDTQTLRQVHQECQLLETKYKDSISNLEAIIKARQETLDYVDAETGLFRDYPDLLDYFAQRQKRFLDECLKSKAALSKELTTEL